MQAVFWLECDSSSVGLSWDIALKGAASSRAATQKPVRSVIPSGA
jgi:hypothetical protein